MQQLAVTASLKRLTNCLPEGVVVRLPTPCFQHVDMARADKLDLPRVTGVERIGDHGKCVHDMADRLEVQESVRATARSDFPDRPAESGEVGKKRTKLGAQI